MNPPTHKVASFFRFHEDPVSPMPHMRISAAFRAAAELKVASGAEEEWEFHSIENGDEEGNGVLLR